MTMRLRSNRPDDPSVSVAARVPGPHVAACFTCDEVIPLEFVRWYGEPSARGRVLALLPYCDHCVPDRERRGAIGSFETAIRHLEKEDRLLSARAA
jgi:hypothetical protein